MDKVFHLDDNDKNNSQIDIDEKIDSSDRVNNKDNNTFVSKQCDNYSFWLSERDFYPPEDKRYIKGKNGFLGSKNMYIQYLSEFYDYYKECFEDMFEE